MTSHSWAFALRLRRALHILGLRIPSLARLWNSDPIVLTDAPSSVLRRWEVRIGKIPDPDVDRVRSHLRKRVNGTPANRTKVVVRPSSRCGSPTPDCAPPGHPLHGRLRPVPGVAKRGTGVLLTLQATADSVHLGITADCHRQLSAGTRGRSFHLPLLVRSSAALTACSG